MGKAEHGADKLFAGLTDAIEHITAEEAFARVVDRIEGRRRPGGSCRVSRIIGGSERFHELLDEYLRETGDLDTGIAHDGPHPQSSPQR
jgi:hypothetical protein